MKMFIIKSEKAFGIAGRAWAALDDNCEIIDIISMDGGRFVSESEAREAAGKTRWCPTVKRKLQDMRDEAFLEHRTASRAALEKLGRVVSGMASCGEFIVLRG